MSERRYTEDEVARIFERAAEAQHGARRRLPSGEGMTLAELQSIGREVGIPAELVSQAARSLEPSGRPGTRRFLGFPVGVGTTVELGRRITDLEWERLVVDLRETFDARGTVRVEGSFREWTNGNLQALLEPTETGHRLRLRTVKGSARPLMAAGLSILGGALALLVATVLAGKLADPGAVAGTAFLAAMGLGVFGSGALVLPGWAKLRRRQMEAVAARAALAAGEPSAEPAGEPR